MNILYLPFSASIFALFFVLFLVFKIRKVSVNSEKIREISRVIQQGAEVFLKREFKIMAIIFVFIAGILGFLNSSFQIPLVFLTGGILSALAGFIGMTVSTRTNGRVAEAAKSSFFESFRIAFLGGEVMGFLVVGFGLLGITIIWFIFENTSILINYAFGASLVGLFMRVGGGIYTKSADIGADLVGKVEKGIPEDDPRNPAVIADQVGDNVGDTAGMGADLFESYVSSIIAAMVIGLVAFGIKGLVLPLLLASAGILSSFVGSLFILGIPMREVQEADFSQRTKKVAGAMMRGTIIATFLIIGAGYFIITGLFGEPELFYVLLLGIAAGFLIGQVTEYYTSERRSPTLGIAKAAKNSVPQVIIEGMARGMESSFLPAVIIAIVTIFAYYFSGLYGIAIASVGILAILGINLSTDCYGPIADNAAGISEMAGLEKKVRERTEALDAVGNTTAATGKGFAISAAALTALAWLATYFQATGATVINFLDPKLIAGLFIGSALSFLFCSLLLRAVIKGSWDIIKEVRRQFREIKGLMEGKVKPDYNRCIDLATKSALRGMLLPAILIISIPILVISLLGVNALGGVLVGSLITAFPLALFMANSGGAWDNAKKYIEAGNLGGKGSEAHKASIIGDMIGDPFKDTAGPSLNILIKLISIISLILVPFFI